MDPKAIDGAFNTLAAAYNMDYDAWKLKSLTGASHMQTVAVSCTFK